LVGWAEWSTASCAVPPPKRVASTLARAAFMAKMA